MAKSISAKMARNAAKKISSSLDRILSVLDKLGGIILKMLSLKFTDVSDICHELEDFAILIGDFAENPSDNVIIREMLNKHSNKLKSLIDSVRNLAEKHPKRIDEIFFNEYRQYLAVNNVYFKIKTLARTIENDIMDWLSNPCVNVLSTCFNNLAEFLAKKESGIK